MKNAIYIFSVLLVFWIAGCSWFYICKVRMDCKGSVSEIVQVPVVETVSITPDSLTLNTEASLSIPPEYIILFGSGSGSCNISDGDLSHFSVVKSYAEKKRGCMITVTGYADNSGPDPLNLQISTRRAEFIRQQMIDNGIPAGIITASGLGETNPIADNNTADGRAKNRRVIIQTN